MRLSTLTDSRRGVDCLTHRKVRNPDDATEPQRITRKRTSQGLPIESIIRAYRTSAVTEEVRRQIEKVELLRALRAGTQDAETWRSRGPG